MSIICTTYTADAIIMAADSRVSITMNYQNKDDASKNFMQIFPLSDNMEKVFLLEKVQVGISANGGLSASNKETIAQFMHQFEREAVREGDSVFDVAEKLKERMANAEPRTVCHVAGYDGGEPFFYSVSANEVKRVNAQNAVLQYGVTWSGEMGAVQKMMLGDPKPTVDFKNMLTVDAAQFTEFLIDTSINMQRFEIKPKTSGGPIDLLILTSTGAFWYKHKLFDNSFKPIAESQRSKCYITDAKGNTIN